jgi:acyl-coenzyme A synthetase/AMP-(fatty) acid ligase
MRRSDLEPYLDCIDKYNITDLIVVPPIITAILATDHLEEETRLKKVKSIVCGTAALCKEVQPRFRELLTYGVPLTQG